MFMFMQRENKHKHEHELEHEHENEQQHERELMNISMSMNMNTSTKSNKNVSCHVFHKVESLVTKNPPADFLPTGDIHNGHYYKVCMYSSTMQSCTSDSSSGDGLKTCIFPQGVYQI
jgi:hypothetical protein